MNVTGIVCCVCLILIMVVSREVYADDMSSGQHEESIDKAKVLKNYCNVLCASSSMCPRICRQVSQPQLTAKRAPGVLDGFTFDDYLFMRLLGRNSMQGNRR